MTSDPTALDELQNRSLMTTPVTLIEDDVVVGFDISKLSKFLGIS